jgi:hypothetical protein
MNRGPGRTWALFLAVFAALAGLAVPRIWERVTLQDLRISNVQPPSPVQGRLQRLTGIANFPHDKPIELWIVVEGHSGGGRGGLWPQGAVRWKDGDRKEWACDIALGSPDEREVGSYTVWAVFADPQASGVFRDFVQNKLARFKDEPLEEWPPSPSLERLIPLQFFREPVAKPIKNRRGLLLSDNWRLRPTFCRWPKWGSPFDAAH